MLLASTMGLSTSGCSFMFVTGPEPADARGRVDPGACTTSVAWPVVDTLLASWFVLNVIINASKSDSDFSGGGSQRTGAIGLGMGLTALTVTSAGVGFNRTSGCKEALATNGFVARPPRRRHSPTPYDPYGTPSTRPSVPVAPPAYAAPAPIEPSPAAPAAATAPAKAAPPPASAPVAPESPVDATGKPAAPTGGAIPPAPAPPPRPQVPQQLDNDEP